MIPGQLSDAPRRHVGWTVCEVVLNKVSTY